MTASALQLLDLYELTNGTITTGFNELCDIKDNHLRDYLAVVSEHLNLFDTAIAENMWYGNQAISDYDIRCTK